MNEKKSWESCKRIDKTLLIQSVKGRPKNHGGADTEKNLAIQFPHQT